MKKWPTVQDLAKATPEEVNEMWSGLGYYRRAKFLHEGAKQIVENQGGKIPSTMQDLEEVKGIGKYTAGAVSSIAFGEKSPIVGMNYFN
jgi:A/G-specific adenine glycosylase